MPKTRAKSRRTSKPAPAASAPSLNGHPSRTANKIKPLRELAAIVSDLRKKGRQIALCHGVFDLIHPGHIVHFKDARRHGDLVVVTVTPDRYVNKGPGRPLFHQQLRMETLAALEHVDFVALNEWPTATETIRLLKPHVYVKGGEYSDPNSDLTGQIANEEASIRSIGGRVVFTEGFTSSSSHLINRFFSAYPAQTQEYLADLRTRFSTDQILGSLKALADLEVLVVGEAIIDQYSYCLPMGKSPKEAVVATRFVSDELFAGGAVATANHLAGFCRNVTYATALGPSEEDAAFLKSKLRANVRLEAIRLDDRPTVRKTRFVDPNYITKMFEIQFLDDSPLPEAAQTGLARLLEMETKRHDLIVVNDFGHGLLPEGLRDTLSSGGKFLALNTQSNAANHGYNTATNYRRADFVSIDEPELRLAARNKFGEARDLAAKLRDHLQAATFLVSLGRHGSIVLTGNGWIQAPALATRIVDRTGAGDALFAVTSPLAFRGVDPEILAFIGNCVGAMAVEIVCNREPINPVALQKFITTLLK